LTTVLGGAGVAQPENPGVPFSRPETTSLHHKLIASWKTEENNFNHHLS
jgi:hypothetical protein